MPVWMVTEPWIGMVVEVGAVKLGKPMGIVRKVSGSPIHQHTDSSLVRCIDEGHEVLGGSEPTRDGKIARGLIAPRSVKRMLHDREKFYMGIAHILHVRDEL